MPQRVVGVDSSTQATKVIVCDAETGEVLAGGRSPHPEGTECPPEAWWRALDDWSELLDGADAIGVAAQQHGMVALDEADAVVRPALLWNDTRSGDATTALIDEMGGARAWATAVGSVPVASFTVTKLRWLAEHEPDSAARTRSVLLPHDWLTWRLLGPDADPTTDRGDASGTGYWNPGDGTYRADIVSQAFGRTLNLPRVLAPDEPAGRTADGRLVSAGTGDNMAAALGLDPQPGDVVVSLGTSGTVFARHDKPVADESGAVAGFADATGGFLPLVCTLNAAQVLTEAAVMLDTDLAGIDSRALAAKPGADGLVFLPYLNGERTPNLPRATGSLHHLRHGSMTAENIARAAVEGMLCGLADGLDALRAQGIEASRVLLIGGAAQSAAVQAIAPSVFGLPVAVPAPREYVALGAARQAAWALLGTAEPPAWPTGPLTVLEPPAGPGPGLREHFRETRHSLYGL